jgi:uncharacterized membrane protein
MVILHLLLLHLRFLLLFFLLLIIIILTSSSSHRIAGGVRQGQFLGQDTRRHLQVIDLVVVLIPHSGVVSYHPWS